MAPPDFTKLKALLTANGDTEAINEQLAQLERQSSELALTVQQNESRLTEFRNQSDTLTKEFEAAIHAQNRLLDLQQSQIEIVRLALEITHRVMPPVQTALAPKNGESSSPTFFEKYRWVFPTYEKPWKKWLVVSLAGIGAVTMIVTCGMLMFIPNVKDKLRGLFILWSVVPPIWMNVFTKLVDVRVVWWLSRGDGEGARDG